MSCGPVRRSPSSRDRATLCAAGQTVVPDLRDAGNVETVRTLADHADVLVEGFRPGVAERLGLGPDELSTRNERLVYARMTGWGQSGP